MKKILFALALLLTIGAVDALAQSNPPLSNKRIRMKGQAAAPTPDPPTGYYNLWVDSGSGNLYITNAAGTDTPVGAGISGLTDNVIPQANGTTAIENSKMTTSGANSGTWTLYDDTAVTGETRLVLRQGAVLTGQTFEIVRSDGTTRIFSVDDTGGGGVVRIPGGALDINATAFLNALGMRMYPSGTINWTPGSTVYEAFDTGIARSAAGILKVTDGSTGQGGIGIADSATNTVSDALILRHQGGTVDVGFGTGLLFQAENEAGTMHTIAGIDAVWVDDVDATEDSDLKFYTMEAGAKVLVATMNANDPSLASRSLSFNGVGGIEAGSTLTLESASGANIRFGTTGVAQRWVINGTTGHFHPDASFSNTYDIGTSSARVRAGYFADLDVYDPTATTGVSSIVVQPGAGQSTNPYLEIYRTYTDASNYERLAVTSDTDRFTVGVTAAGTGAAKHLFLQSPSGANVYLDGGNVQMWTSGSPRWEVTSTNLAPLNGNSYDVGSTARFVKDSYLGTSIQGTRTKTLKDNTITDVVQISSTAEANANGVTAGRIQYTVVASDATTDIVQTETGVVPFLLVNENGTVTVTLGTVYGTAIDSAGGAALANTFASSVSGTNAVIRVTSNYDQATLTGTVTHDIRYRVFIDSGTATVTPQ